MSIEDDGFITIHATTSHPPIRRDHMTASTLFQLSMALKHLGLAASFSESDDARDSIGDLIFSTSSVIETLWWDDDINDCDSGDDEDPVVTAIRAAYLAPDDNA